MSYLLNPTLIDCIHLSPSAFSTIICSLPVLEGLDIGCSGIGGGNHNSVIVWPSTSPPLTRTLSLSLPEGMECTMRCLLGLQICTPIRKLDCTWWFGQDFRWTTALIEQCYETLEYVDIEDLNPGKLRSLCLYYQYQHPVRASPP